jgi:hypothetical protein
MRKPSTNSQPSKRSCCDSMRVSKRLSTNQGSLRIRTIDNGGSLSVNVYYWIVSVYGSAEALRFFVAFSLLSLLKAGLDSPAFFTDPRGFSPTPEQSGERPLPFVSGGSRRLAPVLW